MTDNRPHVYRGHLDECFQHYRKWLSGYAPKGSRGVSAAQALMAKFCGVAVSTIARWLYHPTAQPYGNERMRLMWYLDLIGYRVLELEHMAPNMRCYSELVGFSLIDFAKIAKLVRYQSISHIAAILAGEIKPPDARMLPLWEFWTEHKAELAVRRQEAERTLGRAVLCQTIEAPYYDLTDAPPTPVAPAAESVVSPPVQEAPGFVPVQAFTGLVRSLSSLLDDPEPLNWSEAQLAELLPLREEIVRLVGQISILSARLQTAVPRPQRS